MAFYKQDIVDINLNTGNIHRSFLNHAIGYKNDDADRFGIRTFRDGVPQDLTGASCQAVFMAPNGSKIALTSYGTVSGNVAYVTLPPACYDYEGQFCLAIQLVGGGVTGTMRIVDGMVVNTGASGTVAPTSSVPTYQEIIAQYDAMVAATAAANGAIAATYSGSATYKVGDYCIHDGGLYRCTTAITTAEAWNAAHWTATKIGPDVSDLKSALNAAKTSFRSEDSRYSQSIFSDDEIESIPLTAINDYGYRTATVMSGLIIPLEVCLVNDKITVTSGSVSGVSGYYHSVLFFDENMTLISSLDTAIPTNGNVAKSSIPSGTYYVGLNRYSADGTGTFKIKCNAIINRVKYAEDKIEHFLIDASLRGIELSFYSTTGYYNSSMTFTTYGGVTVASVAVSEGEIYFLTSRNYYGMARVAFMNSSNVCIGVLYTGNNETNMVKTRFVIPTNATTMLIQTVDGYACTLWEANLKEKLDIFETEINAVIAQKTIDVSLEFESATGYYKGDGTFATYEGVTVANVDVTPGEKYLLTTRDYYAAAIAVFFNGSDAWIKSIKPGSGTADRRDYEIIVPANATRMMVQRLYEYRTLLKKVIGVQAIPVTSVLNGKRITLIGDSITERNSTAMTNWANYMSDWTGCIVQNLGASGTGFVAGGGNPYSNRIQSISNPDIIGIALSFNDMYTDKTIAELTTAAESFFNSLIAAYPAKPIICYVQSPWSAYHYGVEKSDQWVSALQELCWEKGIPFYADLYHGATLKPWLEANRAVYYMNDGEGSTGAEDWVHPNSAGHKVIARILYQKFENNIVAEGLNSRILGE